MRSKFIPYVVISSLLLSLVLAINFCYADASGVSDCGPNGCTLPDPLGFGGTPNADNAPQLLIGNIIKGALGIVGSLALLLVIYGGFTWMTAMGSPEKVKNGRDTILMAALGLVVVFTAYAVINFVLKNVLGGAS